MEQAITGNRLDDGIVVYLTSDGGWSAAIDDSHVLTDEAELAASLARAALAEAAQEIVEPYAIDVQRTDAGLRPLRYREVIRAFGPSIAYGKDA